MNNYNLLILSPSEFENLSRDLLQVKLSVFIESFTSGRDGGIDLRCSLDKTKKIIIQSKRYKSFSSLLSNLKKEAKKLKSIKPDRYIITTTVGLTPENKDDIKQIFYPYILGTDDIFGADDINNLISQDKQTELKYYKLWIASTNVLEKVLHSKIYNQSSFELEEINEQVKLYVQNSSFTEALQIIKDHGYVIISGIPGIGKTTLSRILILYLLSDGFDEFVYLNQSIDEGYDLFSDEKKQVFFFDDFLGKNFFESRNILNEDNKIVQFIKKIKRSPNKVLILATREYILNQAKSVYESFKISEIEVAKCVLDLSSYTNLIKAQIIYNHLFFAEVPLSHLLNLLEDNRYLRLVHHNNYNPRIIETIINRKIWENCEPESFYNSFKLYFDNPESVWLYTFENSLDRFSQYTLIVLLTMGTPVKLESLERALKEFLLLNNYKFQISYDSIKFHQAIRELESTFIRTQKDSYSCIVIEYQNPSIQDFLVNYLKDKNDLILSLLDSIVYSNQFFRIFTTYNPSDVNNKKLILTKEFVTKLFKRLLIVYENIESSRLLKLKNSVSSTFSWITSSDFKYSFLDTIMSEIGNTNNNIDQFIVNSFQDIIYLNSFSEIEQKAYVNLFENLNHKKLVFNKERILDNYLNFAITVDQIEYFQYFENIFPITYRDLISDKVFKDKVEKVIVKAVNEEDGEEAYYLKNQVETIAITFDLELSDYIDDLDIKQEKYDKYVESISQTTISDIEAEDETEMDESEIIKQIFKGLVEGE